MVRKKILSFMVLAVFVLTVLTGCTGAPEGKALGKALVKSSKVTSVETKGSLKLSIDAKGLPSEDQEMFDQFKPLINGTEIKFVSKVSQKNKGKILKGYSAVSSDSLLMPLNMKTWLDYNATGKKPVSKQIIKSPDLFTYLSPKDANKYMLITNKDLKEHPEIKQLVGSSDYINLLKDNNKNTEKFLKFVLNNPKMFSDSILVTKKSSKVKGNKLYRVRVSDTNLKALIGKGLKNKGFMSLTKDYLLSNLEAGGLTSEELKEAKSAIDDTFSQLQSEENRTKIDDVLKQLDTVPILSKKGIDITYTINKKGYIIKEAGTVEFLLDLEKIETLINSMDETSVTSEEGLTGNITLRLTFSLSHSNINGNVAKKIVFPKLTSKNSANLSELLYPEPVKKVPTVSVKKKSIKVVKKNNYVKVKDVVSPLKGKYKYSKGNLNISVKGKTITAKKASKYIKVDGKKHNIKIKSIVSYKGNTYVPVEVFTKAGIKVKIKK